VQSHYFRNFYARRSLRIFPLFYGVLFLLVALTPLLHLHWRPGHLLEFVYLGNVMGHYDPSLNDLPPAVTLVHLWSLAVEEQFYMLWPLVVLATPGRKTLLKLCCGIMAAAFLLRCFLLLKFPQHAQEWCYGELPTHCDGLLCGAIGAILIRKFDLSLIVRRSILPWILSGGGLLALTIQNGAMNYHNVGMTMVGYPLMGVFFGCTLMKTIQPGSALSCIGRSRPLRFFGRYSYGMYIYHRLFTPELSRLLVPLQRLFHSLAVGGVAFVLIVLGLTCAVSVLSYELYERRWLKLKSRFSYGEPATE
jgi:peptidoglycan/LPS O-acetylase OafA/YrhL